MPHYICETGHPVTCVRWIDRRPGVSAMSNGEPIEGKLGLAQYTDSVGRIRPFVLAVGPEGRMREYHEFVIDMPADMSLVGANP